MLSNDTSRDKLSIDKILCFLCDLLQTSTQMLDQLKKYTWSIEGNRAIRKDAAPRNSATVDVRLDSTEDRLFSEHY